MIENKKVFMLGMARSGYEVAKLINKNNEILICDSKDQDANKINELKELGVKFIKTNEPEKYLDSSFDIFIKNPAVFPNNPCVLKAKTLKIPVVNEMEVAYHYINKNIKIIGVTGSNGKTTTTTLIYEVLKKANVPVKLGGNIGTPLSQIVKTLEDNDILLLEISDHQLIDMYDFKTDISVLTNLCPTHLDYHGNYENYKNVKKKIFNNHTNNDIAIINNKNNDSLELTKNIKSTKLYFNTEIIKLDDIFLKGMHNYENILAMLMVINLLNVDLKYVKEVLKEFKGVEHRIEFVRELNGVKYYNDSKSTNPISTVTALKSFDNNINLILGGMDRKQEFDDLIPYIKRIKKIYAIGEVRNRIIDFCKRYNIPFEEYEWLKDALNSLKNNVTNGDIVLLSPGSASWDQYAKFEDRGDEFKSIVKSFN